MATNYNVNPYYDDYDEGKQFYRILFRPGRAVQARELTQIQTSLQKQIERFGKSIYKEGSIVVPGGQYIDRQYYYVKLTSSFGANTSDTKISSLINSTITGANSKVSAIVVNSVTSTSAGDPSTIYVRYTSSSAYDGGSNTVFQPGEVITNSSGNISLQVAATSATGNGTAFSVSSGVVFTKGVFAYFDDQTIIAEKYTQANNVILGFQVTESTVSATSDTTLLDPAVGASNYIAPGADRYKIALDLSTRPFTFDANDDPNFIELARLEDGVIVSQNLDPKYSVLGATLARRTYDESGDYIVRPYGLQLINHLKPNANIANGYYTATQGGDDNKLFNVVTPGKAYIKGFEVENIRSRYIVGNKAREYANVNNGIISTTIGNYIYVTNVNSVPDFSSPPVVNFYNQYNAAKGTNNGTLVGTARAKGLEFYSGTSGTSTAVYKLWLFDVVMAAGYVFERDVKQIYSDNTAYTDFTADISPTLILLSGTVTKSSSCTKITGVGTEFIGQIKDNDYITIDTETFKVDNVVNSSSFTTNTTPVTNTAGSFAYLNTVVYNDTEHLSNLFEMPYKIIRQVDPTNLETSYTVKRSYSRTLSANTVSITAGTDETFASISATNYAVVVKNGTANGTYLNATSLITRGGSPTGKTITIDVSSLATTPANVSAYTTADIEVLTSVQKTNSAATKKTKTLVSAATVDYTSNVAAQASTISLGKADIYRLVSVSMSTSAFGTSYSSAGAVDITDRYTSDNGQKLTYYGVGTISLKPNQIKPSGPIRITFDYFTHGTGDYFSVNSYGDINYKDIPAFTNSGKTYQLRDCLDFRPRINDAGTGFTGTGASVGDFISPTSDVQTDYSYYLPRIDKIAIDTQGIMQVVQGVSSLDPKEPKTPDNSMGLFVLDQKAYVFDIDRDISITTIENKRYTMQDIGRIENRVKNLEYYTALSLLEKDTQSLQIQDGLGFDRFKNGFIVDNFAGHGIGDVYNRDYGVAIDYEKQELRPLIDSKIITLNEVNTLTNSRTANNYSLVNDVITLPYTETVYIKNDKASKTENINPFSVITWHGFVKLDPPSDSWVDTEELPLITRNENGNYDQFSADARAKGTYGSVWNSWQTTVYGSQRVSTRTGLDYQVSEKIDTKTIDNVVISTEVVPKMRSTTLKFTGQGLKPNTRIKIFFDNINVTNFCRMGNVSTADSNANTFMSNTSIRSTVSNLITDNTGAVEGFFNYVSDIFKLTTGEKSFRITDSAVNSNDFETLAETTFSSSGKLQYVRDEVVSTRNAVLSVKDLTESKTEQIYINNTVAVIPSGSGGGPPTTQDDKNDDDTGGGTTSTALPKKDVIDIVFQYGINSTVSEQQRKDFYNGTYGGVAGSALASAADNSTISASLIGATGTIDGKAIIDSWNSAMTSGGSSAAKAAIGVNDNTLAVYHAAYAAIGTASADSKANGLYQQHVNGGVPQDLARQYAAAAIAAGVAAAGQGTVTEASTSVAWRADAVAATTNAVTLSPTITSATGSTTTAKTCSGVDPLAQSFFVDTPLVLTKVDLFFFAKDSTIPMKVEIRKMVNGFPSSYIVPFSTTYVYPSAITTSDDGSVTTSVSFDSPLYLDVGEYAIVLLAESINYRVWISEVGGTDVLTNSLISEQPYIGVLFKSQNASTWNSDQFQDLKFRLYRAVYDTTVTATVDLAFTDDTYGLANYKTLGKDPLEVYPKSSTMRVYHDNHGHKNGSTVRLTGFISLTNFMSTTNSNFYGIDLTTLENQNFTIDNATLDSYTITLPNVVNSNVTSLIRVGGDGIAATSDFKYDTYYSSLASVIPRGTSLVNKIKTTSTAYAIDSSFTTISTDNYNFANSRVLASNANHQVAMGGVDKSFVHRVELSTSTDYLSPILDTKRNAGIFVRNLINYPTYNSENIISANDVVTVANASNILVTQVSGAQGLITFTGAADKANASAIIKGSYLNITANNGVNAGQYRVLDVLNSGANVSVYNVSTQNVSTNATATYTITNGRNFVAEEAAYDGSAYSKYITREVNFVNPCTAFKFYVDAIQPSGTAIDFYYKVSQVGDTIDLKDKEYTKVANVIVTTSLSGEFYEVSKIVDNLPQFDAIVFKIVFNGTDSSQVPKCRNLRVIALA